MKCLTKFGMVHCYYVLQPRINVQGENLMFSMLILLLKLTMYGYMLCSRKTDMRKSWYSTAIVSKVFHH